MDAIRLHSDGTLSSEAPFAGLLRMRLELDGDVTLRSFFRLLKRNPLARELVPGLGDALAEAEACPASGLSLIHISNAASPGCPMTTIPSGRAATALRKCVIMVSGFQSE